MNTIDRCLQMQPAVSSSQLPWETFLGKARIIKGIQQQQRGTLNLREKSESAAPGPVIFRVAKPVNRGGIMIIEMPERLEPLIAGVVHLDRKAHLLGLNLLPKTHQETPHVGSVDPTHHRLTRSFQVTRKRNTNTTHQPRGNVCPQFTEKLQDHVAAQAEADHTTRSQPARFTCRTMCKRSSVAPL